MAFPNPICEFYNRLGHKVIQSENTWWCEFQPKVLLSIPNHKLIKPQETEINALMHEHKLRALRYPTTLDNFGFVSTVAVNTNRDYDLNRLHQKARNQTRRGLENCRVEKIDFRYLVGNGLVLNQDTAERQHFRNLYADQDYWQKYCQAAELTPGVSAWGAFVDGKLAAFLVAIEVDGWAEWVVNHSLTALRNKYANNALAFQAASYFLRQKGCKGVCYGLGSLETTLELDHFKQRMGWTLQPIKQRLVFSKQIRLAFSLANEPSLNILARLFPKSYTVRKTSSMIRLYRQQTYSIPSFDSARKSGEGDTD